jgi:hypothetical protein
MDHAIAKGLLKIDSSFLQIPSAPTKLLLRPLPPSYRTRLSSLVNNIMSSRFIMNTTGNDGPTIQVLIPQVLIEMIMDYSIDERIIINGTEGIYSIPSHHITATKLDDGVDDSTDETTSLSRVPRRRWTQHNAARPIESVRYLSDGVDAYFIEPSNAVRNTQGLHPLSFFTRFLVV